ncbi:MAG: hypothetical protein P8R37_06420 [Opitutae bacterium]|jgi:hypothetical protein|nr:hypothetical protein [Opitutae bacterium]MDG1301207.1 hypothetical protein [Opitutae bacterium]
MNLIVVKLKKYPVALISTLVFIGCVIVVFVRGDVIADLSQQETEMIAQIRMINNNVTDSRNLDQDGESLRGYVAAIDQRLFNRNERSINTNFFYSFEDKLDITIADVSQLKIEQPTLMKGGPNELSLYSGIVYEIRVGGTFQEIIGFMYEIQRVNALARIANFEVYTATAQRAAPEALLAKLHVVVLAEKK